MGRENVTRPRRRHNSPKSAKEKNQKSPKDMSKGNKLTKQNWVQKKGGIGSPTRKLP